MGKRKRRLHSPKYAKKCASVRANYARLRGEVEEVVEKVVEKAAEVVEEVKEVVKEVRVYNNQTDTEMTIQEMVRQELNKCKWEWKEVKLTKDFDFKTLKILGEQGWKHEHTMTWRYLKDDWKNKPDSMFFQRPKYE